MYICKNENITLIKREKTRNQYKQASHLIQDTTWESDKTKSHHIQEGQEVSPFPAGDHKAATNKQESMTKKNLNDKNDPQKQHLLGKGQ